MNRIVRAFRGKPDPEPMPLPTEVPFTVPEPRREAVGTPRTEAGKGLLTQSLRRESPALRRWIEMIEAEATAAAEQRLAGLREALRLTLGFFEEACEFIAEHPTEDDRLTAYMRHLSDGYAALSAGAPSSASPRQGEPVEDYEQMRRDRGWPTPNHMRRAADALDIFTPARYGDVLRWFADLADASLPALSPDPAEPVAPDKEGNG